MGKPSARVGLIIMLKRGERRGKVEEGEQGTEWRGRDESGERETERERERLNLGIELRLKKSYIQPDGGGTRL